MNQFQVLNLVILVLLLTTTSTRAQQYVKTGCHDTCGKMMIPFPFGIGSNCSLNEWYNVDCKDGYKPYLSALNNLEVLGISLNEQTVTVILPMITDCQNPVQNSSSHIISNDRFFFSHLHNILVVQGCGSGVIMDHGTIVTECATTCNNKTISNNNNCFGIGCCLARIPKDLSSFTLNLTGLDGTCGSAFLVDQNSYVDETFSNQSIPISLSWKVKPSDSHYYLHSFLCQNSTLGNSESVTCNCNQFMDGNPYLPNGCREGMQF